MFGMLSATGVALWGVANDIEVVDPVLAERWEKAPGNRGVCGGHFGRAIFVQLQLLVFPG